MPLTPPSSRYERLRASDKTRFINGNLTSSSATLTVWSPPSSKRFVLKGWRIVAITTGNVTTSVPFVVQLIDSVAGNGSAPVFAFEEAPPNGVVMHDTLEIPDGWVSGAAGRDLKISTTAPITNGVLYLNGIVWGEER